MSGDWQRWLQLLYQWLGTSTGNAPLNSANVTGTVASGNLSVGSATNVTNDAQCIGVDVDASLTTVKVGKTASADQPWNVYRNGRAIYQNIAAHAFAGKSYATDYYAGYDVVLGNWTISTSFADITGDDVIRFHCRTSDAQGAPGAAQAGGGGSAEGGTGGFGGGKLLF